ncbi:MAG TPA: hypothetical protein VLD18_01185, partial [Verrucomicrobiae bacterium]|nr:hypothetical protein [Verrucomicrobiae bacterium]
PDSMPDGLMVGTVQAVGMLETLKLALRLQPDTRRVVVVSGSSSNRLEPEDVSSLADRIEFVWLIDRSIAELRDELSRLPDQTVVLYGTMFRDPAGNAFTPREALEQFATASRVPIHGHYDTYLGHGIVGGPMITYGTVGRTAAQTAIRILNGETPRQALRGTALVSTPMFDWRQLRRWNIKESRLPPNSIIQFREPTLWDNHPWTIIGATGLFLAQAALIAALFVELRRRRQAEAAAQGVEACRARVERTAHPHPGGGAQPHRPRSA